MREARSNQANVLAVAETEARPDAGKLTVETTEGDSTAVTMCPKHLFSRWSEETFGR